MATSGIDPQMEARGKARIDFEVGGEDLVRTKLAALESASEKTTQTLQKLKANLEVANRKLELSELNLAGVLEKNAVVNQVVHVATTKRIEAENNLDKAERVRAAAESELITLTGTYGSKLSDIATATQKYNSALTTEETTARKLIEAQNVENGVLAANHSFIVENEQASLRFAQAKQRVADVTNQVNTASQKQASQTAQQVAYEEQLTTATNTRSKVTDGLRGILDRLKGSTDNSTSSFSSHNSILTTLGRTVNSTSQGFSALGGTGGRAAQIINTGFVQLPSLFLTAGSALGAITAGMAALAAVSISAVSGLQQTALSVKGLQNAVGGTTQAASSLNILSRLVGLGDNANISLGFINQSLFKADSQFAKMGASGVKALDNIQDRINKLNIDRVQKLADLKQTFDDSVSDLNVSRSESLADHLQRERDVREQYNLDVKQAGDDLTQALIDQAKQVRDARLNLETSHTDKITSINQDISNLNENFAQKQIDAETSLQERLRNIDEAYANKKLSLQEKYFTASPLLRPFIKQQIDALERAQQGDRQQAIDENQRELAKLRTKYNQQLAELQAKLAKEQRAYQDSLNELNAKDKDATEKLNREHDKRLASYRERLDKEQRSADEQYARELRGFTDQQVRLEREYKQRIDITEREYLQSLANIQDKQDELLSGVGGGGGIASSPLELALKQLNLDLGELDKLDGAHKLFAIAQALKSYDGLNKTGIFNTLAGFFGPTVMNFVEQLAESGATFEEFEQHMADLAPDMQLTKDQVHDIFLNFMDWNSVGVIIDDIKTRFALGLLPVSQEIVKNIKEWWKDPENRDKLLKAVDELAKGIGNIALTLTDLITGKKTLKEVLNKILGEGGDVPLETKVKNAVQGYVKQLFDFILTLAGAKETIDPIGTAIHAIGVAAGKGFVAGIQAGVSEVFGTKGILDILFPITDLARSEPDPLHLITIIDELKSGSTFEQAIATASNTVKTFNTTIETDSGDMVKAVVQSYQYMNGKVFETVTTYTDTVSGQLVTVRKHYDEHGIEITNRTDTTYKAIADKTVTTLNQINNDTAAKLTETSGTYRTYLGTIKNEVDGSLQQVINTVDSKGNILKTSLVNPVTGAETILRNKISDFRQLGEDLVAGFQGGWDNAMRIYLQGLPSQAQQQYNLIRQAWDSHSPSKKMITLGKDVGEGFNIGYLQKLTELNNMVGRNAEQLANSAASNYNTTNNYSTNVGVPSINIYAQPGQSPQDIGIELLNTLNRFAGRR